MPQYAFSFLLFNVQFQGSLGISIPLFESMEQKHGFYNGTCLNQNPSLVNVVTLDFSIS